MGCVVAVVVVIVVVVLKIMRADVVIVSLIR